MSQQDFDITTADANTGTTMRAAINAALQALASCNSGATAPGTTYPYQLWADTTSGFMKIRNAGNTSWIQLFPLAIAFSASALANAVAIRNASGGFTGDITGNCSGSSGSCTGNAATATNATNAADADKLDGQHGAYYQPAGTAYNTTNCPNSLAAGGYQKLASGLIIQWGIVQTSAFTATWTFPTAFGAAPYSILAAGVSSGGAATYASSDPGPSATAAVIRSNIASTFVFVFAIGI